MRAKDDIELELARVLKMYRAAIRLKHALDADEECNRVLPRVEAEFYKAVEEGKPFQLKGSLLEI